MKKYWPNLNSRGNNYRERLWDHEYRRHGSCFLPFQTQSPLYFQKTVDMAKQIGNVTDKLFHPGLIYIYIYILLFHPKVFVISIYD